MSEVLKISYRGFGGFLLLSLIFTFATASFAFLVSGVAIIALAIYILINPAFLEVVPVMFISTRITSPLIASALSMVLGIIIILLGSGFLALTNGLWNYGLKLDKGLSRYVDTKVPKTGELLERVKKTTVNHDNEHPRDKISKLERLARLREQGVLTQSEFEQEKQMILKEKD